MHRMGLSFCMQLEIQVEIGINTFCLWIQNFVRAKRIEKSLHTVTLELSHGHLNVEFGMLERIDANAIFALVAVFIGCKCEAAFVIFPVIVYVHTTSVASPVVVTECLGEMHLKDQLKFGVARV